MVIGSVVPVIHISSTLLHFISFALFFWWSHGWQMHLVGVVHIDLVLFVAGNAHVLRLAKVRSIPMDTCRPWQPSAESTRMALLWSDRTLASLMATLQLYKTTHTGTTANK